MQGTDKQDCFNIKVLAFRLGRSVESVRQSLTKKKDDVPPPIKRGTSRNSPIEWSENVYRAWQHKREEKALAQLNGYCEPERKRGRPRNY